MLWDESKVVRSSRIAGGVCRGASGCSSCVQGLLPNEELLTVLSHLQVGLLPEGQKHPLESSPNPWPPWTESIRK